MRRGKRVDRILPEGEAWAKRIEDRVETKRKDRDSLPTVKLYG